MEERIFWWIKPYKLILYFIIPLYIFIYIFTIKREIAGVQNYISGFYFILGLSLLLIFSGTSFIGSKIKISLNKKEGKIIINDIFLDILALLTIIGYLVWFGKVFLDFHLFMNVLLRKTGTNGLRGYVSTIPGITTLVQLGIVYIIMFSNNKLVCRERKQPKRFYFYMIIIVLFTIFRVFAWSERLALIEILISFLLIKVVFGIKGGTITHKILRFGPYIGILLLFVFFGITEYFRSWSYYQQTQNSLINFVIERVLNYYSTALNNGAGLLHTFQWPTYDFTFTFQWFFKLPFIGQYIIDNLGIKSYTVNFLEIYGNPEFNNVSALYVIPFDLGILGGFLFVVSLGILTGLFYKSFIKQNGIGMILYPIFFITILEIMRELYIADSRTFPTILFSLLGYFLFSKKIILKDKKAE